MHEVLQASASSAVDETVRKTCCTHFDISSRSNTPSSARTVVGTIKAFLLVSFLLIPSHCDGLDTSNDTAKRQGQASQHYHVLVYRATPAGIAAAIALGETLAKKKSDSNRKNTTNWKVLLVEPTAHVGGMATEGGIGLRDGPDVIIRTNPKSSQYRWGMLNANYYNIGNDKKHKSSKKLNNNNNDWNRNITRPIWQPDSWVGEQNFLLLLQHVHPTVELRLNTDLVEGRKGVRVDNGRITMVALEKALESNYNRTNKGSATNTTKRRNRNAMEWIQVDYVVDASYEGDIMAAAGVPYTYGREAQSTYNESYGGVTQSSISQFRFPVDATRGGDHGSELLPYLQSGPDPRLLVGQSDDNVMAYSYRVCLTKVTKNNSNAAPIIPPPNYDPKDFELARRYLLAELQHNNKTHKVSQPWLNLVYHGYEQIVDHKHRSMKYDACCGPAAVGIDAAGLARSYPLASRAQRRAIANAHRYYVQGLMWFWRNDTSVPADVRAQHLQMGLCRDEWPDNGHFPRQLYVREALRMVGDRVFTQNDRWTTTDNASNSNTIIATDINSNSNKSCRNDSIAVASWGFDIHDMQRVAVLDKTDPTKPSRIAYNEGLTPSNYDGNQPFDLPYWVLLPNRLSVTNLLVPNCPSVSHVAFAAIRVEPTLWYLGQASGTAVAIALRDNQKKGKLHQSIVSVLESGRQRPRQRQQPMALHDVSVEEIQKSLLAQGGTIHWPVTERCPSATFERETLHVASAK